MAPRVLVDSGPLVELLDRQDIHHRWVQHELASLHEPLLTCEAVLSEVFFLLSRVRGGISLLVAFLREGLVSTSPGFSYYQEATEILRHLERYSSIPMSFADACLVRMSELERNSIIF